MSEQSRLPRADDPGVVRIRRVFLTTVVGSCVLLVPWIGYLAAQLPPHHAGGQWKVAWVGFDVALVAALAVTGWLAWGRRQLMLPCCLITATLLVCDAWFDIVLNWGTSDLPWSIASALLAELPLAALLFYVANRVVHAMVQAVWRQAGRSGPPPPLRRVRLVDLFELPETSRVGRPVR